MLNIISIQLKDIDDNTISLVVDITDKCNYNCYYCFNVKPRLNIELNLDILVKFLILLHKTSNKNLYIELLGGETSIHNQLQHFINTLFPYYPKIRFCVYTNLSLNIDFYLSLLEYNVNLTITWHSLPNDRYNKEFIEKVNRIPFKYFENELAEIHVMYENKYLDLSITVYTMLNKLYSGYLELCLLDHDFKTSKIFFTNDYYSANALKTYTTLFTTTEKQRRKFFTITYDNGTTEDISLATATNSSNLNNFKNWLCAAGFDSLYIDMHGNIFPCTHYSKKTELRKKYYMGNIKNVDISKFKLHKHICLVDRCACSWEVKKDKIFK